MPATTMTSREFNQDTSKAKKAANEGPVFITDRGKPAHVLLSIEEYQRLAQPPAATSKFKSLAEALGQKDVPDFEFDPPRLTGFPRAADFD
jgi:prevent-host-death family protein